MDHDTFCEVLYEDTVPKTGEDDKSSSKSSTLEGIDTSDGKESDGQDHRLEFRAKYALVTYNRSRVVDHMKFYEYLQSSINARLLSQGKGASTRKLFLYGGQELHQDVTSHYHVVMAFSERPHWRNAREKFAVSVPVNGGSEVDTLSIRIQPLKRGETPSHFLDWTQAYVCKEGNKMFGERIYAENTVSSKRKRDGEIWSQAIEMEDEDGTRKLLKKHFPQKYIQCYIKTEKFIQSKKRKVAVEHVPDFPVKGWVVPPELLQWRKENFGIGRVGRPISLILIGPPRCGKTQWALSFGRPVEMSNMFCFDALTEDCTHLVVNDMVVKNFKPWEEFMGGQMRVNAKGKYRAKKVVEWGKPTIWTCNKDNDLRKDPAVKRFLASSSVLVVEIDKNLWCEDEI
ncbi:Putative geminivirus AL1 replication-associated protein, CLV type [Colletotrichum destructivum]|uniref:Geminivirus AL1 replication-associated protein, CLV type n=1 Tax=Colletotrichum destructivum TaxID=34406 RepID=A0AAX4J487_9PEZI|nr:Putative geminivirus AL1 replication-associated protein, CLV type [Colletotrichum destructivum]